jgi:hypothetical protein
VAGVAKAAVGNRYVITFGATGETVITGLTPLPPARSWLLSKVQYKCRGANATRTDIFTAPRKGHGQIYHEYSNR